MLLTHDLMILVPDGVSLTANLWLPEDDGPFPAILEHYTCYIKDGGGLNVAHPLAAQGYAVMQADFRGTGSSQGIHPAPPVPVNGLLGHGRLSG